MPNISAALAGLSDVSTPRPRETPNARDDRAEQPSFDDAFAERARARQARPSEHDRQSEDQAPEEQPATEPTREAKRNRAEAFRRAAAADRQAQSGKAGNETNISREASADPAAALLVADSDQAIDFAAAAANAETNAEADPAPTDADTVSLQTESSTLLATSATSDSFLAAAAAAVSLPEAIAADVDPATIASLPTAAVDGETGALSQTLAPKIGAAEGVEFAQDSALETAAATNADAPPPPAIEADAGSGEARKADDAKAEPLSAPILADVSDEAAVDLQPGVAQAQAAAVEKAKVKTRAAAHALESIGEFAPQADRAGPTAAAHSAPEIRLAPVHAQASVDAAAQVIAAIRADKGSNDIDVRLDPPELGRVKISFSFERSDIVTATVSSERTDTLDLMRRHQDELARELERAGFSKVRLDFAAGDSGRAFSDQPRAQSGWRDGGFAGEAAEEVRVHYLSLRTDNRLDRLV